MYKSGVASGSIMSLMFVSCFMVIHALLQTLLETEN